MKQDRRHWLKLVGLVAVGVGVQRGGAIAAPVRRVLPEGLSGGPLRLSSNENPYGPSPKARAAMAEAVGLSNRYQWDMILGLMRAIAAKYSLAEANVLVGAGSTQLIDAVVQHAAMNKGSFVVSAPTFSRWTGAAEKSGLQKIEVALTAQKKNDLNGMLAAMRADTQLVYLCNPNNPTGTYCRREDILLFLKEATKKALVLVDEAYLEYSDEASLAGLVAENRNLVVVKTFSKIYGLAGARIGYALGHEKTIEKIGALQSGSNIGISAVSLAGALASLKDEDFVKETQFKNATARAYASAHMERLKISCIPSCTNFIYFSLAKYQEDFFARLKVHNIEGTNLFEEQGKWSRITVGTEAEMEQFINAIS